MKKNITLFSYCIPFDTGAAPNPYWGICTLAICKPVIRRIAKVGDWIVGTGSKEFKNYDITNSVVYTMEITKKLTFEEYDKLCSSKYTKKIPNWKSNDFRCKAGDCIYDFSNSSDPNIRKSVHDINNKKSDLNGKYVLLSTNFYYFGNKPEPLTERLIGIVKKGPGHKSKSNDEYIDEFLSWISNFKSNKIYSKPQIIIGGYSKNISICSQRDLKEAIEDEKQTNCF